MKHYKFSPSSAHRWTVCTASPDFIIKTGAENKSTSYSIEGSRKHRAIQDYILDVENDDNVDIEDHKEVSDNLLRSYGIIDDNGNLILGNILLLEKTLQAKRMFHFNEDTGGTPDLIAYNSDTGVMLVCDWKFGVGIKVNAEGNKQLAMQALLFIDNFFPGENIKRIKRIDFIVAQSGRRLAIHSINQDENGRHEYLDAHNSAFNEAQRMSYENPVFAPSYDTCRFCPAKKHCKSYREYIVDFMETMFFNHDSLDEKIAIVKMQPMITAFMKDIKEDLIEYADANGGEVAGESYLLTCKKVAGDREWIDSEDARSAVKSSIAGLVYESAHEYVSPAKAEKILGKEAFKNLLAQYVKREDGGRMNLKIIEKAKT